MILADLKNRVDKVGKIELELDAWKEKYKKLESFMSDGQKQAQQKGRTLEKNLEQLTQMYHQLITSKSTMKNDIEILEKKLVRKREHVTNLDKQVSTMRTQVNGLMTQVKMLLSELENHVSQERLKQLSSIEGGPQVNHSHASSRFMPLVTSKNIKKPIRGGGKSFRTPKNAVAGASGSQRMFLNAMRGPPEEEVRMTE